MPEKRDRLVSRPPRREDKVWAILRRLAPVSIAIGVVGILVGLVAGQPVAVVAIDLMIVAVGVVLLLLVRWR